MKLTMYLFRFLFKNAIAGGTIYYTKTLGVWDSSDKTCELYERISTEIDPLRKQISERIPLNVINITDLFYI